jgi:hypothetical protein
MPWFGYSLGAWTPEDEAEIALRSDHFVTGEKARNHRVKPQQATKELQTISNR